MTTKETKKAAQTHARGKLAGKCAIVTGSDSGIGQAIAIAFAREGADVAVTYHSDQAGADETRREIEKLGRRAVVIALDVAEPEDVQKLFGRTHDELGLPTILVNNAAVPGAGVDLKDMPYEVWDRCLKVNLYGPFLCCQRFLKGLEGNDQGGVIINVSSVHEEVPMPGFADYNVAKGGLRMLTRTLALEVARKGVNVNNIAPGMIMTAMNQNAMDDPEAYKKQVQPIPMKRAGEPEEIAQAAVYLASRDARYVNGTTLVIDGALTLSLGQGA